MLQAICPCFRRRRQQASPERAPSPSSGKSSQPAFSPSSAVENDSAYVNIILYGDSGVGKTCLRNRWVEGRFTSDVSPTLGIDFNKKELEWQYQDRRPAEKVKMKIFDMSGRNGFMRSNANYLQGFAGIVFVYDVTNKSSLRGVEEIVRILKSSSSSRGAPAYIIAGNKADVPANERRVSRDSGQELGSMLGISSMEVSAQSGSGVEDLFMSLTSTIMNNRSSSFNLKETQGGVGHGLKALARKASKRIMRFSHSDSTSRWIGKGSTIKEDRVAGHDPEIEPLMQASSYEEAPVAEPPRLHDQSKFASKRGEHSSPALGGVLSPQSGISSPSMTNRLSPGGRSRISSLANLPNIQTGGKQLIRSPNASSRSPMASSLLRDTSGNLLADWGIKTSPGPMRSRSPGPRARSPRPLRSRSPGPRARSPGPSMRT